MVNAIGMPYAIANLAAQSAPTPLNTVLKLWHLAADCSFPLPFVPKRSYKDSGSGFGTPRPAMGPGILHPACDLEAPVGTSVLAVDDGEIIRGPYYFYLGSYAIEVRHRYFVVRYGEIKNEPIKTRNVKRGDVIGHVGNVGQGFMLHFEMFAGTATGDLTVKPDPPWNRRKDLMDPTPFLDLWALGTKKH
jgi:murein DD-endopeptidase MepM/ murein hydrolase activator NlpD